MPNYKNNGKAVLEKNAIVIRVPLPALKTAVAGACDMGFVEGDFEVTATKAFAKEVIRVLNDETEDGTTAVHRMFDAAFNEVIDQGGDGIEEIAPGDEEI